MDGWGKENLRSGRTCGVERLVDGTEKIPERVAEGLHNQGAAIFLTAEKVKSSQLPRSYSDPVVQKSLLHPKRIEARSVPTHQIAGVGESPDLAAQVASRLPQPRGVKAKPLPLDHPVEIDVARSSNSFPSSIRLFQSPPRLSLHTPHFKKL